MILRDKFKSLNTDFIKSKVYYRHNAYRCEKIADDYAIEILERYHNSLFNIPLKEGEAKKIVEHIKKGL